MNASGGGNRPREGRDRIIFSLIAVLTVLTGAFYAYLSGRNHRQAVGRELESIAALKTSDIFQWRKERIGDVSVFAGNENYSAAISQFYRSGDREGVRSRLLAWLRQVRRSYGYDRVFLLDTEGKTILAYPEEGVDDRAIAAAAPDIARSEAPGFLDFYRNPRDGRIYLAVAAPVGIGAERAVLAFRIDPERYLYPYIIRWPTESATAETLLVRREGDEVVFLNQLRFNADSALRLRYRLSPDMDLPAGRAILGERGIYVGTDYRGMKVLSVLSAVKDSPWYVVARMDMAEVDAGIKARLTILLILVLALLALEAAAAAVLKGRWRLESLAKEAEAARALTMSEERLRLALAAANQGLYDLDLRTGEVFVSDEYALMLGYVPGEFNVTLQDWSERLHPDDRDVSARVLDEYLEGKLPEYRVEFRQRTADGGWKWILSLGKVVERDEKGAPMRMLGTHTDISAQKESEEALRKSEARYRETLDGMLEGCQIISRDWRYLYLNDSAVRYSRKSREELIGRTMMECYPGIETTELFKLLRSSMEERTTRHMEYEFSYPGGEAAWYENSFQPCAEGLFILSLDITERKKQERALQDMNAILEMKVAERTTQLESSNKELEAFSYSVAHDLRAPLRSIDGFARILGEEYGKVLDGEGRRLLGVIRSSAQKLDTLIHDLLEVTRIGRTGLSFVPVDMRALATDAFLTCADPASLQDFDFTVGDLPVAMADRQMMGRIWGNLLANAVKYSLPSKVHKIEVEGESRDGENVYSVRDRGVGFDPRYADKLFGMFQRLHRAEDFDGTGVGLAITRRIVERHGGRTWAEGKSGEGAAFYFSIPTRS